MTAHPLETPARRALNDDMLRLWTRRSPETETVVLLDPDPAEATRLSTGLERVGFHVLTCSDPLRALAHVGHDAALIIASVRLGEQTLSNVVEVVRSETTTPVLIAYDPAELDLIGSAVSAGGHPVIALPYDVDDVACILHRELPDPPPPPLVEVEGLSLVPNWYDTHYRGHPIDLSRLEFNLLLELASHDGRAVTRSALVSHLWPNGGKDTKSLLGAAIRRIRLKLEPFGIGEAITTVRGIGYRLDPTVLRSSEAK